ncbi:hypothetical protein [Arcticibacterium luteifluviistationis]|uniref:Uncharacterized protein n=1 Tax=Arcticibacterium luteifluviistationis TaxID=1784714 RepID=A0A2Z4GGQ2_9BACT|nr:hypothetical protein [Arcticibacterium luteifluviistationis]AWW00226.1 hypothetical protein DJ013_19440 [Arcticibacterium luteifluviistationis]
MSCLLDLVLLKVLSVDTWLYYCIYTDINQFPNIMTIQKSTFLIAGFISLGMLACNSDSGSESAMTQSASSTTAASSVVEAPAAITATTPSEASVSQVSSQPSGTVVHPPTKLGKLMNLSAPANFSASGSGLNPAHGMPGHNCDVSVGAPLPQGPVAQSTPVASSALAAPKPTVASTPNFKTNLKNINPAHGQPGHDCAVAVGAPLPAKGASSAATPSNVAAPAPASTPNFGLPANVGKVNPAHGQPGHDCGIAVGAPLPG